MSRSRRSRTDNIRRNLSGVSSCRGGTGLHLFGTTSAVAGFDDTARSLTAKFENGLKIPPKVFHDAPRKLRRLPVKKVLKCGPLDFMERDCKERFQGAT